MQDILSLLDGLDIKDSRHKLDKGQVEYIKRKHREEQHDNLIKLVSNHIRESETLRCEINKSNDPKEIIDKALKCISLLSGDMLFYETNIKKFIDKSE